MRILFIEDEPKSIEPVKDIIKDKLNDLETKVCGFGDAEEVLLSFRPDIVILDILRGGTTPDAEQEGLNTYDYIWDKRFCPIVVYSAQKNLYDDNKKEHPFVTSVQKGSNSEYEVLNAIRKLTPHIQALQTVENQVRQHLSDAMKHVAPYAFKTFTEDDERRQDAITRSGRRRIAAMMDEPTEVENSPLASWEHYLYPPISSTPRLGDILKTADGNNDTPDAFRVILTPSCDMESSPGRRPKVQKVLVAKCCSMDEALKAIGMNAKSDRFKTTVLSQGYYQSIVPYPTLKGVIPTMAANLRDLELVDIEHISNEGDKKRFHRIASTDSPFRELISWAYLQTSGRPGLPERDLDTWANEIIETLGN